MCQRPSPPRSIDRPHSKLERGSPARGIRSTSWPRPGKYTNWRLFELANGILINGFGHRTCTSFPSIASSSSCLPLVQEADQGRGWRGFAGVTKVDSPLPIVYASPAALAAASPIVVPRPPCWIHATISRAMLQQRHNSWFRCCAPATMPAPGAPGAGEEFGRNSSASGVPSPGSPEARHPFGKLRAGSLPQAGEGTTAGPGHGRRSRPTLPSSLLPLPSGGDATGLLIGSARGR
jgi:hypothetical protein